MTPEEIETLRAGTEVIRAADAWYEALGPRVAWQDATGTALADAVREYREACRAAREVTS